MSEVKVEPSVGPIPEIKTTYYYVQSSLQDNGSFRVNETTWTGSMSDSLRLAKGNVYLSQNAADVVCLMLNERLLSIQDTISGKRQGQTLKEEQARKKEEAAERKRLREEEKAKGKPELTSKERAIVYKRNKEKRAIAKKSPHPDIIV